MRDPKLTAWAETLTTYCTAVQPGDRVVINGGVAAEPLLREIYRAVLRRGGHPVLLAEFSSVANDLLSIGNDEQIGWISPIERYSRESADVLIRVMAETNTRSSAALPPDRNRLHSAARTELRQRSNDRAAAGEFRWTLTIYPTAAYAQDAEMSTTDYEQFIYQACKLDQLDPAAAWRDLRDGQQRLIDWLTPRLELRMVAPGTDLTVSIAERHWINSDGKRNFPSGEVFTGPVEDSADGYIRCSYPVITNGREITDIRLKFENGVVIDAAAAKNEAYLLESLATDPGARRLGEVAVGTNFGITQFTGQILLDEKIGGTAHIALGSGYPETGSINRSAIHWDLICDLRHGGRIDVDGEPLLVDGAFLI